MLKNKECDKNYTVVPSVNTRNPTQENVRMVYIKIHGIFFVHILMCITRG
jgi:hypothetical protein